VRVVPKKTRKPCGIKSSRRDRERFGRSFNGKTKATGRQAAAGDRNEGTEATHRHVRGGALRPLQSQAQKDVAAGGT